MESDNTNDISIDDIVRAYNVKGAIHARKLAGDRPLYELLSEAHRQGKRVRYSHYLNTEWQEIGYFNIKDKVQEIGLKKLRRIKGDRLVGGRKVSGIIRGWTEVQDELLREYNIRILDVGTIKRMMEDKLQEVKPKKYEEPRLNIYGNLVELATGITHYKKIKSGKRKRNNHLLMWRRKRKCVQPTLQEIWAEKHGLGRQNDGTYVTYIIEGSRPRKAIIHIDKGNSSENQGFTQRVSNMYKSLINLFRLP